MPMLDASLAFALTMLALASVVTLVIEIIHRILQLRAKGLQQMLEGLYDQEIGPWVDQHLDELGATASEVRKTFLQRLLTNPLVESTDLQKPLRSLEQLSDEGFLRLLGETGPGKLLLQMAKDKKQEAGRVLDGWAQKYELYGRAASDYFSRRANVLSIIAGVILAFAGNIHAVRIFDTYLQDTAAAKAVIAESGVIQDDWKQAKADLDQALGALKQSGAQDPEKIEAGLDRVADRLESLGAEGVPLGWDPDLLPEAGWPFVRWFGVVLLTGFLLGLGGPFWFRVVTRLSQVRRVLSGGAPGQAPPAEAGAKPPTTEERLAMLGQPDAT